MDRHVSISITCRSIPARTHRRGRHMAQRRWRKRGGRIPTNGPTYVRTYIHTCNQTRLVGVVGFVISISILMRMRICVCVYMCMCVCLNKGATMLSCRLLLCSRSVDHGMGAVT